MNDLEAEKQELLEVIYEIRIENVIDTLGVFCEKMYKNEPEIIKLYYEVRGRVQSIEKENGELTDSAKSEEFEILRLIQLKERAQNTKNDLSFPDEKIKLLDNTLKETYKTIERNQNRVYKIHRLREIIASEIKELGFELRETKREFQIIPGINSMVPGVYWVKESESSENFIFSIENIQSAVNDILRFCISSLLHKRGIQGDIEIDIVKGADDKRRSKKLSGHVSMPAGLNRKDLDGILGIQTDNKKKER